MFSTLGFYPLAVGSGDYTVGSPMFDSATVNLGGKHLTVNAKGASSGQNYVAGVDINGESIDSTTFDGDLIRDGGTLTFTMSGEPSNWGAKDLDEDLEVPEMAVDATTYGTFSAAGDTEIEKGGVASLSDNSMKSSVTFTGNEASLIWKSGSGPVALERYTLTALEGAGTPESWALSGSLDGETWVEIDSREGESFPFGTQTRPFSVDSASAFTSYKLDVTGTEAKNVALAEIELFGGTAESSDLVLLLLIQSPRRLIPRSRPRWALWWARKKTQAITRLRFPPGTAQIPKMAFLRRTNWADGTSPRRTPIRPRVPTRSL